LGFKGLWSLKYDKPPFHIIAVYIDHNGRYVTISNQHIFFHRSLDKMVRHYDNRYKDGNHVRYLCVFDLLKDDVYFNKIIDCKKEGVYHG